VLVIVACIIGAAFVAAVIITFVAPWWPSSSANLDEQLALLSNKPSMLMLAGLALGVLLVAGITEFVVRRSSIRGQVVGEEPPYVRAWPELTVSIANKCIFSLI